MLHCTTECLYHKHINASFQYLQVKKIIQMNEWGCRDGMHHAKNCGHKEIPLAILSRILAQACETPLPELCRKGLRMLVLVSLIVLLRGFPCFHNILQGASHPYIPIEINDVCTCSHIFHCSHTNVATCMRTCIG